MVGLAHAVGLPAKAWVLSNTMLTCGLLAAWRLAQASMSMPLTGVKSSRLRVLLGSAVVAASTAWLVGGADTVLRLSTALLRALPWVVTIAGMSLLLRAAVPKGRLAGTLILGEITVDLAEATLPMGEDTVTV